jgi:hypothetical protein
LRVSRGPQGHAISLGNDLRVHAVDAAQGVVANRMSLGVPAVAMVAWPRPSMHRAVIA